MDYFLTDEQKEMKKLARQIAEEKIKPVRVKYDEQDIFPRDIVDEFVKAGMFKILVPPKYGGTSGRIVDLVIITEEFSKVCVGISLSLGATGLGLYPILISGNEEQKQKYLREIAQGKKLAAFALTEPEAGSDAASVKTTAVKNGDYYVLNGTKQWITNGSEADIYSVFALTDKSKGARGISAFIVEKGTPGFSFGKKENKLGIRGSITSELIFDDCRIPKYNLLGREGMGFMIGMKTFDKSRPMVAAQAIGVAQGALDELMKYIKKLHNSG
ncbi:MAG: acyl-CoA dehydrogenase, partial [Candidatus Cloacimonadota bacterium]